MEAALQVGDEIDEVSDHWSVEDANRASRESGEIKVIEAEKPKLTVAPDQLVVTGTHQLKLFEGKTPGTSVLKLKGVTVSIDGAFAKGEVVRFTGSARIVSEGAVDKLDKDTGMVVESVATNQAVVLDFEIE